MIRLNLHNETSKLKQVILGIAKQFGGPPALEEVYDPKSRKYILEDNYPVEPDLVDELAAFESVLKKYDVHVLRPENIPDCNQIYARDIGFVIEDKFVQSNILPLREKEQLALKPIYNQFAKDTVIKLPQDVHVEGGDVLLHNQYILVGICTRPDYADLITARTNIKALKALQDVFPNKKVVGLELKKSNTNPFENALHLDCAFQPVGNDFAIIHRESYVNSDELAWLEGLFQPDNIFYITDQEMYDMMSNVFSIAPDVVVSDPYFSRLNQWLRSKGFTVEEVSFREIAKQEGLFRCTTLPLERE